jgi:DNA-directed RNA polymerase subunit M/transcription elongation factor TFIIS
MKCPECGGEMVRPMQVAATNRMLCRDCGHEVDRTRERRRSLDEKGRAEAKEEAESN